MKIAILGSTRGTDMQAIIDELNDRLHDVEIAFVLSNKRDAYILERAKNHTIKHIYLDGTNYSRENYDKLITMLLEQYTVKLIVLIGYMRLMSDSFVDRWCNKVMNIHPSLLPAYAGGMDRNVHDEVLKRGCKVTGASLIFIDKGADTGPIIDQRTCVVKSDDTVDTLKERVQGLEKEMIVDAIALYRDGKITVDGNIVKIEDE